ncbi:MAG: CvpA family protein [Treponema sp.]|jgi:membrane protein required for colicin V production|nr:CvpA family protein [Treponema sp.]
MTLDIVFAVLILLLVIRCALRGLIKELSAAASLVLGVLGGVFFHKQGGAFIRTKILAEVPVLPEILAFIGIFLLVFFAMKFLERILRDIIEGIHLGGADHALGILFGLVEGIALIGLILLGLTIQPLFDAHPLLAGSIFARILLPRIQSVPLGDFLNMFSLMGTHV